MHDQRLALKSAGGILDQVEPVAIDFDRGSVEQERAELLTTLKMEVRRDGEMVFPLGRVDLFHQSHQHALVGRADVLQGDHVETRQQLKEHFSYPGVTQLRLIHSPQIETGDTDRFTLWLGGRRRWSRHGSGRHRGRLPTAGGKS